MDAVSDAFVREIWVQKSAQVGWTEILNNVIGYYVDQDPSPILMVQPTEEVAVDWSRDRLAPMIRDTPCLRGKFSDERTRATANTLRHKTFPGGLLAVAISNSPASLASKPIRIALFDEVDKYPISAKQAGDPLSLGRVRTKTFWNRKILAGSTPTVKGSSRVEKGFETSDQRYYFVPCPHCNEFQRLVWAQVKWSEFGLTPEQAVYQCVHCAASIEENAKADMLARGEWRASKPFNGIAGFHISELYSPWSSWGQMARDFLDKKAFPETLQQWINEALGETWEDSGEKLEPIGLMERRESYTAASIPAGVQLLTVGTDVQDDRLEVFLYGWARMKKPGASSTRCCEAIRGRARSGKSTTISSDAGSGPMTVANSASKRCALTRAVTSPSRSIAIAWRASVFACGLERASRVPDGRAGPRRPARARPGRRCG